MHDAKQADDSEIPVGKDNITSSIELEEQPVLPITKLQLNDPIRANLGNRGHSSCPQEFSKPCNERRRGCSRSSGKVGKMTSKARVDDERLALIWFGEFEEKDTLQTGYQLQTFYKLGRPTYGREIVDV
jgi:hypothetical protein